MSGRRKKVQTDEAASKAVEEQVQAVAEDDFPNYVPPTGNTPADLPTSVEEAPPVSAPTPTTAYEIAQAIRADIKRTLMVAPKRNDGTTMPAIVNLRCRTGDFHFLMPQFDALSVQKLWERYKGKVEPEQFVSYLYTTMGYNPPKLYMFMNIINIS